VGRLDGKTIIVIGGAQGIGRGASWRRRPKARTSWSAT